jgi:MFS family permease
VLWQPQFAQLLGGAAARSVLLGVILAGCFVMGAVGNLIAPHISRRLGGRPGRVSAVFHGLRGAVLVGLALQGRAVPAMILFWFVYLGQGAVNSAHTTLLNDEIPSHRRSSMLSIESLVQYAGGFIGNAGLGFIAQRTSISFAWGLAGGVLLVSWFLYLRIDALREVRRHEQPVACPAHATPDAG